MQRILVSKNSQKVGIITYNKENDKFHFKYDEDFKGYPFGEINCNIAREFESDTLFSIFAYTRSFNREKIVEKYNLGDGDSNSSQWFFLKLWAERKLIVDGLSYQLI